VTTAPSGRMTPSRWTLPPTTVPVAIRIGRMVRLRVLRCRTSTPNVRAERTPEARRVSPTCDDGGVGTRRAYTACRRRSARARGYAATSRLAGAGLSREAPAAVATGNRSYPLGRQRRRGALVCGAGSMKR
jgi:hypothetical protein